MFNFSLFFFSFLLWWHNDKNAVVFGAGTDQPIDFFVGDVTSYTLHNLQPGTTYDVKVIAQYTGGMSSPLIGEGTTRTYSNRVKKCAKAGTFLSRNQISTDLIIYATIFVVASTHRYFCSRSEISTGDVTVTSGHWSLVTELELDLDKRNK